MRPLEPNVIAVFKFLVTTFSPVWTPICFGFLITKKYYHNNAKKVDLDIMFSIMRKRGKRKRNRKRKNIMDLHNEIKDMKEKCIDYENKVKNWNEKLTSATSEKCSILQLYQKQVFDLKEDIKLLKKSTWIGIENYAKMKIESLEKQVEKGNSEIQELKNEVKELNVSLKARNDKVNRLIQLCSVALVRATWVPRG